jgi:hypothetical protein
MKNGALDCYDKFTRFINTLINMLWENPARQRVPSFFVYCVSLSERAMFALHPISISQVSMSIARIRRARGLSWRKINSPLRGTLAQMTRYISRGTSGSPVDRQSVP